MKGQPVRFIRGHISAEVRAIISAKKKGIARDAATRAKISAALTGRTDTPDIRAKKSASAQRGDASAVWVGKNAAYNTVHTRARQVLPDACELADESCRGVLEVALKRGLPANLVRTSARGHSYYVGSDVSVGYMRLCRSHHRRYDAA